MSINWKHNDLMADLATHLRATRDRIVWEDMQLGPVGSPRPDVYTVPKSFARFLPLAYEIKVSVSDFRSDITKGKWQDYYRYASGVIFAVPQGMVSKEDVPNGAGLMVRKDDGWRTLRAPTMQREFEIPKEAWIKLLIDGTEREAERRLQTIKTPERMYQFRLNESIKRRYGASVAAALVSRDVAESRLRGQEEEFEKKLADLRKRFEDQRVKIHAEVNGAASELAVALGLEPTARTYDIVVACKMAGERLRADAELQHMLEQLQRARKTVEHAAKQLEYKQPHILSGEAT